MSGGVIKEDAIQDLLRAQIREAETARDKIIKDLCVQ